MKADREYKKPQTRIIQSVENRKAKVAVPQGADRNNTTTAQLFAIPQGLHDIIDDVTKVQNDIMSIGDPTIPVSGSEKWALDTRWATLRKLEEWNLVKHLSKPYWQIGLLNIGAFGENNVTEPDGFVKWYGNNYYLLVGENKVVSGQYSQINVNIKAALEQLCTGKRVAQYYGANLVARVVIPSDSEAGKEFARRGGEIPSTWYELINTAYNIVKDTCASLTLIICYDSKEIFHYRCP